MIDIALNLDVTSLAMTVVEIGWPGLLIGAALGLWAWRERRSFGSLAGAFLGVSVWAALDIAVF